MTGLLAAISVSGAAIAQVPAGYPADYQKIIDGAKKEGKLVIYSATDTKAVEPMIKDFRAMYPDVQVEYNDMNSTEVYNRYISEMAAGGNSADLMWSSAMDLQVKLVSDGYGMTYASPEIPAMPQWAVWNNAAYGTTFEPAVFVYNKRLVTADEVPKTHAEFAKLLTTKGINSAIKSPPTISKNPVSALCSLRRTAAKTSNSGIWPKPSAASRCACNPLPARCWNVFLPAKTCSAITFSAPTHWYALPKTRPSVFRFRRITPWGCRA